MNKQSRNDPYWEVVREQHDHIRRLYQEFARHRPVMLFDIQEQRVYAYPYGDYAADLSKKSQRSLAQQYQAATKSDLIVVFIRDNDKRRLTSYSVASNQMTNPKT
jgi:hypothetical protein